MSKEMIISVNGREKKIAILDHGKVTEFYIERGEENSGVVGNIYKGRVQRVLPGMQSAFVEIGLERDAFLYVSDFFDEEEELERIVMEKSKKTSPEEAKREAVDQIERARVEREKQMEAVQEIAEPLSESTGTSDASGVAEVETTADDASETTRDFQPQDNKRRDRNRGRKDKYGEDTRAAAMASATSFSESATDATAESDEDDSVQLSAPVFEIEDSGFERVIDDEDTGEIFKDAFVQEAIVDQVRAVEFDMETTDEAEVGSLLSGAAVESNGFQRIADEDETVEAAPAPAAETNKRSRSRGGKGRGKKAAQQNVEVPTVPADFVTESETVADDADRAEAEMNDDGSDFVKARIKNTGRGRGRKNATETTEAETVKPDEVKVEEEAANPSKSKKPGRRGRKSNAAKLEDGEASVRETEEKAEMAVRRGGRGRRRGGRGRMPGEGDENGENGEAAATPFEEIDVVEAEFAPVEREQPAEKPRNYQERPANNNRPQFRDRNDNRDRSDARGGDNNRGGRNDRPDSRDRNDRNDRRSTPTISDLLREGQEILVQIAKEPIAKKGARITSHIALPGRFLVYMPTIEHLGVSRKIESASERTRLRNLIQSIKRDENVATGGFIVRTAGVGISDDDLRQDARYLVRTWQDIKKNSERKKSPALVHQDLDIIQRLLRDHLSDEYTAIRVDSEEEYLRIVEFINRIQPKMVNRVKLYTRETPILEHYGVQEEIDKALKPRVWLKSGGYLVINQTEALVAIDVNTGKFVGKGNARLEDTITKTNMEAVDEIARQIRLRDLGGIIVLDLIDMEDRRNRNKVAQALQEALASDKSPTKVLSFNDFGLIIMTRKRVKQSLERTMCAPCEYCEGAGWVRSPQTVCYEILEEARRLSKSQDDVRQTTLRVHPEVAESLRKSEREVLEEIEAYLGSVDITADKHIHQAQFDFAFV